MKFDKILTIDIGGSRIKSMVVKSNKLTGVKQVIETNITNLKADLIDLILQYQKEGIDGVAISCTGVIDKQAKKIIHANTSMKKWIGFDFNFIKTDLNLDFSIDNDSNCAALSELYKNDKLDNYLLITFGTGVGAGLVQKHNHYRNHFSGEIGYQFVNKLNVNQTLSSKSLLMEMRNIGCKTNPFDPKFFETEYLKDDNIYVIINWYLYNIAELAFNWSVANNLDYVFLGGSLPELDPRFIKIIKYEFQNLIETSPFHTELHIAAFTSNAEFIGAYMNFLNEHSNVK